MSGGGLYHERVKELARVGREGKGVDPFDAEATQSNPMCGDQVTVSVRVAKSGTVEVGYQVRGCMVSLASCARMAELAEKCADRKELEGIIDCVLSMFDGDVPPHMEEFGPVVKHRSRHECVLLPFKALKKSLGKC